MDSDRPKLEIAEHIIVRHHWITKVRSEVPFRIPCSLPSVVLSGQVYEGTYYKFHKR